MALNALTEQSLIRAIGASPNARVDGTQIYNVLNQMTAATASTAPSFANGITVTTGGITVTSGSLTLTSGNAVLTSGNLTMSAGVVSVTPSAASSSAISVVGATLTTGKGLVMSDLDALTTGIGVHVASAATAITGAGRLAYFNHTGASGTSAVLFEVASAAADETVVARITASAALALGTVLDLSGAAVTTGTILDLGGLDALTTGTAINVVSNASGTGTRSLVFVKNDHASAVNATCLELTNDAPLAPLKTTSAATSTNYFKFAVANGVTIWVGNGTTGQGNLSGTAGDMLINGGSSKIEFCTGTTNWTATT